MTAIADHLATAPGAAEPAVPPPPGPDVVLTHARRVALAEDAVRRAKASAEATRKTAELVYAQARRHGQTQVEVALPDGTKLGLIAIHRGPVITTVDEPLLAAIVACNEPEAFEDHVKPVALTDPAVLALISERFPHYIGRRVSDEVRARYDQEIEDNGGLVTDRLMGERVRVATIEHLDATGKFTYTPVKKAATLIDEAKAAGQIDEFGDMTGPPPPEPPQPAQTAQESPADDIDSRITRALGRTSARRPAKPAGHPPTPEQSAILDAVRTGAGVVISAGAGSGKTTALTMIGSEADGHGIYVAFNKAIVTDAKPRFGGNVLVSTAHALAMAAVGKNYRHRLNGARVPANQVAKILGINEPVRVSEDRVLAPAQLARLVMETVDRFCRSADRELSPVHVPRKPGLDTPDALAVLRTALQPWARKAWTDLTAMHGELKFSHDVYLKLWGLSVPQLSADYVLFDEAQDADAVVLDVVLNQRNTQLIAVGDKAQAIYEWRGAIDAMDNFPAKHRLPLSKSFRFGPAIADEANKWLDILDADLRLTGFDQVASVIRPLDAADAVLCRTNAEVISQAMRSVAAGRPTAIVGGGKDIRALAEAAIALKQGRGTAHPELYAFKTWGEVQDHAENDPSGSDLRVLVNLIDSEGPEKIIEVVDSLTDEKRAQVAISTAHKAKGREWGSVRIASDFHPPKGSEGDPDSGRVSPPDARLAYVAVTRARLALDRTGLAWVDDYLPEQVTA